MNVRAAVLEDIHELVRLRAVLSRTSARRCPERTTGRDPFRPSGLDGYVFGVVTDPGHRRRGDLTWHDPAVFR